MRRHHRVHHCGPVLFRCHVEVQVARVVALGAQGRRGALAQVVADVGQHHFGALAHEQMRRGAAEAHQFALDRRRRAGQQRYFVLESHLSSLSPLIGGRMRHFAACLHRRAAVRLEPMLALRHVREWFMTGETVWNGLRI